MKTTRSFGSLSKVRTLGALPPSASASVWWRPLYWAASNAEHHNKSFRDHDSAEVDEALGDLVVLNPAGKHKVRDSAGGLRGKGTLRFASVRAGCVERGAWCVERGAWSVERGAWSVERGAWSVERGAWSVERGVATQLNLIFLNFRRKSR
eukprot:scaffold1320_cov253-Pinguiococcus_pyrenoidosus.AAC.9